MQTCVRLVPLAMTSISFEVCIANSRVGDKTKSRGQPGDFPGKNGLGMAPCSTRRATVGMTKAKVFPDPVCAMAIRSCFPNSWQTTGTAWRWMSVGRLRPAVCSFSSRALLSIPLATASCHDVIGSGRPSGVRSTGRSSMFDMAEDWLRRWSARTSRMSSSSSSSPLSSSCSSASSGGGSSEGGLSNVTLTGKDAFLSNAWMVSEPWSLHFSSPTATRRQPTCTPQPSAGLPSATFATT
mmetsp:Transcript_9291/g.26096  ORF Transcript_9291/g.26096 Transcript_9291/m.26096 type:complete len:239 (+) Transcript_9291:1000-1716(+)